LCTGSTLRAHAPARDPFEDGKHRYGSRRFVYGWMIHAELRYGSSGRNSTKHKGINTIIGRWEYADAALIKARKPAL
jgi:hypothetical protein